MNTVFKPYRRCDQRRSHSTGRFVRSRERLEQKFSDVAADRQHPTAARSHSDRHSSAARAWTEGRSRLCTLEFHFPAGAHPFRGRLILDRVYALCQDREQRSSWRTKRALQNYTVASAAISVSAVPWDVLAALTLWVK